MTEEEWKAWEIDRAGEMMNAFKPSLERRLEWLQADASAQRTAILRLERQIKRLAGAVALAGIVASTLAVLP